MSEHSYWKYQLPLSWHPSSHTKLYHLFHILTKLSALSDVKLNNCTFIHISIWNVEPQMFQDEINYSHRRKLWTRNANKSRITVALLRADAVSETNTSIKALGYNMFLGNCVCRLNYNSILKRVIGGEFKDFLFRIFNQNWIGWAVRM